MITSGELQFGSMADDSQPSRLRDFMVVLWMSVFVLALPVAGFRESLGFLGIAVAALVMVLLIILSE